MEVWLLNEVRLFYIVHISGYKGCVVRKRFQCGVFRATIRIHTLSEILDSRKIVRSLLAEST